MSVFTVPNVFVANTKIKSASVNANFAAIASTLNTNLLPAVGNTKALVTTDAGGNLQSVLPIGTEGQVLAVDPTATATGGLVFTTPTTGSSQTQLDNLGLAASVTGGAITISLKQSDGVTNPAPGTGAVIIGMRGVPSTLGSFNSRSITAALSTTISNGTTFGMIANQNNSLWVYSVDSDGAGTMVLAVSPVYNDDSILRDISVESAAATIDIASSTVTSNNHGFQESDGVLFTSTGALPIGITAGTRYWVVNPTTNTFQITDNLQNGALTFSGSQSGIHTIHVASPRLVSTMAYTGVSTRLIGKLILNLPTPGTWVMPVNIAMSDVSQPPEAIGMNYIGSTRQGTGNLGCTTPAFDTHGLVDLAGQFLVPSGGSGIYDVEVGYFANSLTVSVGDQALIDIIINGVSSNYILAFWQSQASSTANPHGYASGSFSLQERDVVEVGFITNNPNIQLAGGADSFVSIQKRGAFRE